MFFLNPWHIKLIILYRQVVAVSCDDCFVSPIDNYRHYHVYNATSLSCISTKSRLTTIDTTTLSHSRYSVVFRQSHDSVVRHPGYIREEVVLVHGTNVTGYVVLVYRTTVVDDQYCMWTTTTQMHVYIPLSFTSCLNYTQIVFSFV